jgi:archaetidylinositol phosphate synthase
MVLRLGELAYAVHEGERVDERLELEGSLERVVHLGPAFWHHAVSIYDRLVTTVSTPDASAAPRDVTPRRAGRELLLEAVFRPLSNMLVPLLMRISLRPPAVVLANASTGLLAALALARGELLAAAVLLQVKTLLDNADGQLARATGRATLVGRYLDTLADLVVNAALFLALAHVTGHSVLAAAAFVALTLVLAVDFNITELHREAIGTSIPEQLSTGGRTERILARTYGVLLAPLDRAIRSRSARSNPRRVPYDRLTVTVLANLGLTTQLAVLGLCLALGAPAVYLWLVLACLVALVPLHFRSERRARAAAA